MFSSPSEKPTFSEKIKQELQREEKPQGSSSYTLLLLLFLLLVAVIFFLVALIKNCSTDKVTETSTAPTTETTPATTTEPTTGVENPGEDTGTTPGTTTEAPSGGQNYTVQSGDTLFELGQKFGVDWKKIAEVNNLEEPYSLTVGKTLLIPPKESSTE